MLFGWVTFVVDNEAVPKALVLLNSLRACHTSEKIVVILGKSISPENIGRISHYADDVIQLHSLTELAISPDVAARIQCWSLPGFSKLIFLDASCVVLQNVDNLYTETKSGRVVLSKNNSAGNESSILVLEPSFQFYQRLTTDLKSSFKSGDASQWFSQYLSKLPNCSELDAKYGFELGEKESKSIGEISLPSIAIIRDSDIMKASEDNSIIKDILQYRKILEDNVKHTFASSNAHETPRARAQGPEPVAVVGISCRFPEANSMDEFWELLIEGGNGIKKCPTNRWTVEQGCNVEDPEMQCGFLKCPIDEVDASFFGFNPMELKYTDPQQRLLLEVAHEALEDAGISVNELHNRRIGVFTGSWKDDYKELMIESGFKGTEFFRTYMGNAYSSTSARLSHVLGVTGPNIATESGCSASFAAIREATNALRSGEAEICIASAVNLILHPFKHEDMKAVVSPDFRCKTFDSTANGFARAEGVASLVLKRLSDAVRSGDRVYGLIRGMGMTQEGTSSSMGTPTVDTEALAMSLALEEAHVAPAEVDYVEAHGTGTVVGDPIEVNAITKAYAQPRQNPLLIGAVKTNIGHAEAAAGMASIIKTLLAFKHEMLPPHRNVTTFNPNIDFTRIPATVPLKPTPWKKSSNRKRIAGISNFGISGGDTHMILEEPPAIPPKRSIFSFSSPSKNIVTLSAKTKEALNTCLERLEATLHSNPSLTLDDVAYTLNIGRSHYKHRVALIVPDAGSISAAITKKSYLESPINWNSNKVTRIGFMFPGQGTQYAGMGQELCKLSPIFRHHFDHCTKVLKQEHNFDLKSAIWTTPNLDPAIVSQVAIFVFEYAMCQLWAAWGVKPDVVVGHSLGEFVAAVIAGVMTLEDSLKLVVNRCRLVDSLPQGGMAVVGKDENTTVDLLKSFQSSSGHQLDIAAVNSNTQTVVSGSDKDINDFITHVKALNITAIKLNSTVAFHSRCLEPILAKFKAIADTVTYSKPTCTFISSSTGQEHTDFGASYWVNQTRNSVQFKKCCSPFAECGDVFIDVGAHPILIPLLQTNVAQTPKPKCLPSINRTSPPWDTLTTSLATLYTLGVDVNWTDFHSFLPGEKVALPHYPFQRKKYWFNVEDEGSSNTSARGGKKEFPLIGWNIQTPLDTVIYINSLSLKTVPYVADHKVGEHAVYPGAAYVEMFFEAATKLGFPAVVRNIRFRAPLVLSEEGAQETHTIICRETGKAQIFCRPSNMAAWVCHAEAELSAELPPAVPKQSSSSIFDNIQARDNKTTLYDRLKTLGYNFDTQFQTIQKVSEGANGEFLIEIEVPVSDKDGHICHPIVIDAVMQSFVVTCTDDFNSLHLPSAIAHFEILSSPEGPLKYVHITPSVVYLLDSKLGVVAVMRGMETMRSTFENIQKALDGGSEVKTTPLFEEQWISAPTTASSLKQFSSLVKQDDIIRPERVTDTAEILALNQGIGKGIMSSLKGLGWDSLKVGATIDADIVIQQFGLITASPSHKIVHRLMEILTEEGYLQAHGNFFKILKALPSVESLLKDIDSCRKTSHNLLKEWELSDLYLANLVPILKGKVNALELLFPAAGSNTSAETFYVEAESSKQINATLHATFTALFEKASSAWDSSHQKEIHILEIGAGTGSATSVVLPLLTKFEIPFTYTYTDISSAYFLKADAKFARWKESLIFKTFNVEEPPEAQGFPPNYYHLVVASNVLHATVDLTQTMTHTRQLLRKWGLLVLAETFTPQRHYDITVGHLDGYWRYKDIDLRPNHCTVTENTWHKTLDKTNFRVVTSTAVYNGGLGVICAEANEESRIVETSQISKWIVFSDGSELAKDISNRLKFQGRTPITVLSGSSYADVDATSIQIKPGDREDIKKVFTQANKLEGVIYMWGLLDRLDIADIWRSYLFTIQQLASKFPHDAPKLAVITRGLFHVTDQTPVFPAAATLSGITRSFLTEYPHFSAKVIDLDGDAMNSISNTADILTSQIWSPIKGSGKEALVAVRGNLLHYGRLRQLRKGHTFSKLSLPKQTAFCLDMPKTNSISDLKFKSFNPAALQGDEVEVKIRAIGLNFRDVFLVFRAFDQKSVALGSDVAGVVTKVGNAVTKVKVGDAVFGARSSQTPFPSIATMREDELLHIPDHVTFEEAVTYPVAFSSAYYGLVMLAGMKKGDNVLIHTATGAVGLRAIALANEKGANVYATAGSRRKRAYLKNIGIPSDHIFNSRDTSFEQKILALGKGSPIIDIVLNSVTGPGFKEASLAVCRKSAKFVELSVMNVWTNEEVKELRPDVTYFKLDLSESAYLSEIWGTILAELNKTISNKNVKPMPITHFQAEYVRDALTFLQKAKHVGKIVCSFPITDGAKESPLFNERSLYLLAGGLGGIGLKVAEWMVSHGAKHIVLTSRSAPSQEATMTMEKLNSTQGANVFSEKLDVSSYQEVSSLLQKLAARPNLPILRGVMNLAGALSDGPILEQTEGKYNVVLQSKVDGSWNLHLLTRNLPLEHFVLFSSFAAVVGTPGQSNHAAANSFEDALAAFRHNSGLPATSINWGQWGEAGVVVGHKIHGYTPMPTSACLASLQTVMTTHLPHVIALDGNHAVWKSLFPWTEAYFKPLYDATKAAGPSKKIEKGGPDTFWREMSEAPTDDAVSLVVSNQIRCVLASLLDQPPEDIANDQELGLDSLMNIELRNSLQFLVGPTVTVPSTLSSCANLDELTATIVELTKGKQGSQTTIDKSNESFATVVKEEVDLAVTAITGTPTPPNTTPDKPASQIQTCLLTGITGNLGPYVLQQLTQRPTITRVTCLVQAENDDAATQRAVKHLSHLQVLDKIDMSKVTIIAGTLSRSSFGLSNSAYSSLASSVDAVFNIAAATSHVESYPRRGETETNSLRQVNVLGVREVVTFATTTKSKYIFHASSLATVMNSAKSASGSDILQEGWTPNQEFDNAPNFGYIVSKFVGEKVIEGVLREIKLPVKVFRFPLVCGCSTSGQQEVLKNNFFMKYLYYFKSGLMPKDDIPIPLLPVDHCAAISLAVFFSDKAPSDVYNIVNPSVPSEVELVRLGAKLGHPIKQVDYDQWAKHMKEDKTCLLGALKHFYTDPQRYPKLKSEMKMLDGWRANKTSYYHSNKVEKYLPNLKQIVEDPMITLQRDMEYALKQVN